MSIKITSRSGEIEVDESLYRHLFEASIISDHPDYIESLKSKKITMSSFLNLARKGRIAYALFFGSSGVVSPMVKKETERLFGGFGGKFSLGVRGRTINLNSVRLLIKDIKLKQGVIARFVSAQRHPHIKRLKNSRYSLDEQAQYITDSMGIDMHTYRSFASKRDAFYYLVSKAEDNNIFISIENTGTNMPQNFKHADGLTGVYIKHNKFPYIFIAREGLVEPSSLPARKAFTLTYLLVCLFKGQSKLVSLEQGLRQDDTLFTLTEMILMPAPLVPRLNNYTLDDLDRISGSLNVTSKAVLMRLDHLGYIGSEKKNILLNELNKRYNLFYAQQKKQREAQSKDFRHNPVNNIRTYQGSAFLRVLQSQFIAGNIKRREINRQLAYGKGTVDIEKVFEKL